MFKRLIHTMSRNKSGIALLSGAAALLSGVERALSTRPSATPAPPCPAPTLNKVDRFRIYRSKTDLGYTYWVLQGFGAFQSFALFDTWEQAIQEADRRLTVARRIALRPRQATEAATRELHLQR